jgi:hypothetical protein
MPPLIMAGARVKMMDAQRDCVMTVVAELREVVA